MSTQFHPRARVGAALLMVATSAAQAHPGHGAEGLAAGLVHPFAGFDHLLAMVAVGLWSAAAFTPARRVVGPLAFLAMLLVGALLALAGVTLPAVEHGVALSVVLLAVLMLGGRRIPVSAGLALVAVAALLHGLAHGGELVAGQSFAAYAAGFMLASALLHTAGVAAGTRLLTLQAWAWRTAAGLVGAGGVLMLAARF